MSEAMLYIKDCSLLIFFYTYYIYFDCINLKYFMRCFLQ